MSEERVAAVRQKLKEEMVAKMRQDRSAGALQAAKAEAEAQARCVPALFCALRARSRAAAACCLCQSKGSPYHSGESDTAAR